MIIGSVGKGGKNNRPDVSLIQSLLNAVLPAGMAPLVADGIVGPQTLAAISDFQRRKGIAPTALVSPGDFTWQKLGQISGGNTPVAAPGPSAPAAWPAKFTFEQFWDFTEPLEGGFAADCMLMVQDLQVATGMGITFSNRANRATGLKMAMALEWVYKPGHPNAGKSCSAADITIDYDTVLSREDIAKKGPNVPAWKPLTNCRITREGLKKAVRAKIIQNINYIKTKRKAEIGDFDSFPADAQLCVASLSWSGPAFRFPKFCAACKRADWFEAAKEARFKETFGTIPRRSNEQQLMMHNAGCTALGVASPEKLHFPGKLTRPGGDPSTPSDGRLGYRDPHQISLG